MNKHEKFLERVYNIVGTEYEVLSFYKNLKEKVTIKHNTCHHVYEVSPTGFLYSGNRCPRCNNKSKSATKRLKDIEVNQIIKDLTDSKYELSGKYINNKERIEIIHKDCGKTSFISLQNFKNGVRCHYCETHQKIFKRNTHTFKNEVYSKTNGEYSIIGEYIDLMTPVSIQHKSCGYIYKIKPNYFLQGTRCPACNKYKKKTLSEFKKYVYENDKNDYSVLGEYKNIKSKITMIHNTCQTIYKVTPHNYMKGHRCPKCASSKGEKQIMKYLNENKIQFQKEYTFDDCKNKRRLRFDFAIFKDNELVLIIEYDGEQHFKEQKGMFLRSFKYTQHNDRIKNEYCKKKNIALERIPYTEFNNIDGILETLKFQYDL